MVQLQNPTQSSTNTKNDCAGNKCPASAAIDGDYDTQATTSDNKGDEWWQAEILKTARIDHIMIHTNYYAWVNGYFDR